MDPHYLHETFALAGRAAVVIGGNGALGGAAARALGQAGAALLIVGRNETTCRARVAELRALRVTADFHLADATSPADMEATLRAACETTGAPGVEILVNAAGSMVRKPFLELAADEWSGVLSTTLDAVRIPCHVFGRHMRERGSGAIINFSSMGARLPLAESVPYSCAKAAVENLTQQLAWEMAPHGVRVNAIAPGFFPAAQNREVLRGERGRQIRGNTALGRYGEPDEIATAILFLAAPASTFVTGSVVPVHGGFQSVCLGFREPD
ncbi:MAG: SDR family oxidoreductase [Armatimonadetes bacterium]|nr:SDR family oxidoreductase [Armatimonadota bacterium]